MPSETKVRGELVLSHINKVRVARSDAEAASVGVAAAYKSAKADGLSLDALKLAIRWSKMEPEDAKALIQNAVGYFEVRNPGVLSQGDLFSGVEPASEVDLSESDLAETYAAGRSAGRRGIISVHDHGIEAGSERAARWEAGYRVGMAEGDDAEAASNVVALKAPKKASKTAAATAAIEKAKEHLSGKKPAAAALKAKGPKKAAPLAKAGPKATKAAKQEAAPTPEDDEADIGIVEFDPADAAFEMVDF